jgi:hypothetical protein
MLSQGDMKADTTLELMHVSKKRRPVVEGAEI